MPMRMNVFLQKAGIGSRREAERMVAAGRVNINGRVAVPTDPVEDNDEISMDGNVITIETRSRPRLFILHKPLHVLCTTYDAEGRAILFDMPCLNTPEFKASVPRLMNVGRLDVNSEGLIMMSTDGKVAQLMMSPETGLERTYRVRVHGRLTDQQINRLEHGVTAEGVHYRGARVYEEREPTGANTWYRVILTEGKNREIRKLMEHFGCVVNRLIRIQYGPFKLGKLPAGEIVEVPENKMKELLKSLNWDPSKT